MFTVNFSSWVGAMRLCGYFDRLEAARSDPLLPFTNQKRQTSDTMLNVPFLTELDSRAAVKGSRDPLGIQRIWTKLGRHVVGNLTTVSNSVRDFKTLLLGYHFAEQFSKELGPGSELVTFLKWEQLAGYSRAVVNDDHSFSGSKKVRAVLADGTRVTISADRQHQILGNQKIYGLWGLYTVPARASGLLDGDPSRLTPPARELLERTYLPILAAGAGRYAKRIRDLLVQKHSRIDVAGERDAGLVRSVGSVLKKGMSSREREFFRFHLLYGGPDDKTGGRQQQLAELLVDTLEPNGFTWSPAAVCQLAKSARSKGQTWHPLSHRLDRIRTSESVLAPASALFTYLLGLEGKTFKEVAARLETEWGQLRTIDIPEFRELHAEISDGYSGTGDRWTGVADALVAGRYADVLELLLEQNKAVMAERGGAPWIEQRNGRLRVRFRDEQGALPRQSALPSLWRFPYFLDSLRTVASVLQEN